MIDSSFVYEDTRWKDIFSALNKAGFDVYPPGVKLGECTSEYLVVKMMDQADTRSSAQMWTIILSCAMFLKSVIAIWSCWFKE